MAGPLAGYRIVDCTDFITGPLATMLLADQGAEVVKIERPGGGDFMRSVSTQRGGMSAIFAGCNRSKRSVVLDLREEGGRALLERLVAGADVFVQNFRPGVIERLGLDEARLRELAPELVYVSINAFGERGPFAARPAFDHILQGMAGMAAVQGNPLSGEPAYVKSPICDKSTAYTAAQAITAALLARERGQGGQHVRLSMLDAALAFFWPDTMTGHSLLEEDVAVLPPISMSYIAVQGTDGFFSVAVVTDAQWHGMFRAMDRPDMVEDPRFATGAARSQHLAELLQELGNGKIDLPVAEAMSRLVREDVPCGPILSLGEIAEHPQIVESETLRESEHPVLGRMREPRPPARFSRTPAAIQRPAPALGEHTEEVLAELGLTAAEIAELRAKQVVG